jgi:hypothetical protein
MAPRIVHNGNHDPIVSVSIVTRADRYRWIETSVATLLLGSFILYFGLHCFRYRWVGDIQLHCAAVASLYTDFWRPPHEAVALAGSTSQVHSPYIVGIAAIGRVLHVTPYRALQFAGLVNLCLYVFAICLFFRTFSVQPSNWLPAIAFLAVSLFMRDRVYLWSSETSFASMRLIQAYPSLWAWSVALVLFAFTERYLRGGSAALLIAISALIWALLLSHNLTFAWVWIIISARAVIALAYGRGPQRRSPALLLGAVAIGVVATRLWPYFDITQSLALRRFPEGSEFADHPLRDMAPLYVLAGVAAVWFIGHQQHFFLLAGFVTTAIALQVFRAMDYSYGNRFAFFQAFFAQALVADGIALGVRALFDHRRAVSGAVPSGRTARLLPVVFAVVSIVMIGVAPAVRTESEAGRPLLSLRELMAAGSSHYGYYASLDGLTPWLRATDIVLMPQKPVAWDVASITGARVVISPYAYRVPDYAQRVADNERFLAAGTEPGVRRTILQRYGVSKIVLTEPYLGIAPELHGLGMEVFRSPAFVVIEVAR